MSADKPTFLVTGTMGCIGAWVLRNLVNDGAKVIATDLDTKITRPKLLLTDAELESLTWEQLDVTDGKAVNTMVEKHKPSHIIHLAGLQIPFCKANPSLGAMVNVVGTVNLFEAVRHNSVRGLSYASSVGVLGAKEHYPDRPLTDDDLPLPNNLYGVYKTANENTAKIYWQDWQVGSIGLRPYTVFGVCRDQGMTADIAKACLAVAANLPFHIRFDGPITVQHANDVARIFIDSAMAEHQGADVFNLRNDVIEVAEFVASLKLLYPEANITFEQGKPLPFPSDFDDAGIQHALAKVAHTPLKQAIQSDVEQFRALLNAGKLTVDSLQ